MQDVKRPLPEWSMTRAAPSGATTRQLMRDARRVKRDLSEFRAVAFQDVVFYNNIYYLIINMLLAKLLLSNLIVTTYYQTPHSQTPHP